MPLQLVDLFCGAGGLSLGFRDAGFRPVFAADCDPIACATYRANLGPHIRDVDLGTIDHEALAKMIATECGDIDVVAGGPPCQGFSVQRRGTADDPRNDLTLAFCQLSTRIRPRAIVMENVPTILGARGQAFIRRIVCDWEEAGYDVKCAVLEAAAYRVPQMRRRAFIVGLRRGFCGEFSFPEPILTPEQYITVRQAI